LPPWACFVIWIESFKHHHCPIDDTPKSSPRGSTSKGTNSSHYRHVPSPAEIALAGSVIYGLGIGSVVAVLTAINTLVRALMVDMDNPVPRRDYLPSPQHPLPLAPQPPPLPPSVASATTSP